MEVKLFISQPMRGRDQEEILKERVGLASAAMDTLADEKKEAATVNVLDSYHPEWKGLPRGEALLKSLTILKDADCAIFAPGWDKAAGCRLEYEFCKIFGVATIIEGMTEDREKAILKDAVQTFGTQAQEEVAIEEMCELVHALTRHRRAQRAGDPAQTQTEETHIREEIADVTIMLGQLKEIYGDCKEQKDRKLLRLRKKIKALKEDPQEAEQKEGAE